jgi:hypothetical protein
MSSPNPDPSSTTSSEKCGSGNLPGSGDVVIDVDSRTTTLLDQSPNGKCFASFYPAKSMLTSTAVILTSAQKAKEINEIITAPCELRHPTQPCMMPLTVN